MPNPRRRRRAGAPLRLGAARRRIAGPALPISPPELEAVIEGDRRFFARHTERNYRIRLMARAEIASGERAGFHFGPPLPGMRWVALIRQVHPGARFKAFCQFGEGADLDQPEAVCRDFYERAAGPEQIARGDRAGELARAAERGNR